LHAIEKVEALIAAAGNPAGIASAKSLGRRPMRGIEQARQPLREIPSDAVQIISQHGIIGEAFCSTAIARKVG
jgi:hypothetical protein